MMTHKSHKLIIAIDGYSSCGKSTIAKDLAKKLNIVFIDSGAMYRCITLFALNNGIIVQGKINHTQLENALEEINISFKFDAQSKTNETYLNSVNVDKEIRSLEVSNYVSAISTIGFVRKRMVELQQEMGNTNSIVMDGRDIGTVVFPNADLKIFMTATPEIRAQRRYDEFLSKKEEISFEEVLNNVKKRDYIDENRDESPLKKADDAIVLDNSNMNKEEQFEWIINQLKNKNLI